MKSFAPSGWFHVRPWAVAAFAVVLGLGIPYASSYYHLSRRGMREAKALRMPGFLYIPAREATGDEELSRHYALAQFYAPANAVDHALTGAEGPVGCMLFHLSK